MDDHFRTHEAQTEINRASSGIAANHGEMIQRLVETVEKQNEAILRLGERVKALENERP